MNGSGQKVRYNTVLKAIQAGAETGCAITQGGLVLTTGCTAGNMIPQRFKKCPLNLWVKLRFFGNLEKSPPWFLMPLSTAWMREVRRPRRQSRKITITHSSAAPALRYLLRPCSRRIRPEPTDSGIIFSNRSYK